MIKQKKINLSILIPICLLALISVVTIYSAQTYISDGDGMALKQGMWYLIGAILVMILIKLKNEYLYKNTWILYIIGNILLLCLLLFAPEINSSKCWFVIPKVGSIQPSEFMKISLILYLGNIINKNRKNEQSDLNLIIKCLIITLIPSILTFLEPDTGAVIVYFVILIVMLFVSEINLKWFIYFIFLGILGLGSILYLYLYKQDLFINIFGSSLFYRLDRLFDFVNLNGMQLNNSIISISSSGIFGHGINNIPIYFPELQTDFIFASFTSCFGLLGSIILIMTIFIFDKEIINIAKNKKENIYKYILSGIFSVLIYQQIQNISMTIGLLPITGITLPFISYGGSSLISFMILIGIVLNIQKNK